MLIGSSPRPPNLERARQIKQVLREALTLSDDTTVTVAELACLEEGCAPVETAIGLLRPGAPQLQAKVHKPMDAVVAEDLVQVCATWGFNAASSVLADLLQED
ncbi:MAG: nitrate reductase [Chloroflexota bacterium]|nr:nitrate reductase [Chloroflexota bacterium]